MSQNRFFEIKSNLHVAYNDCLGNTRMAKVKPLYDLLNDKLGMFGIVHEDFSIDESMVPYFGRHSCKQFIRGKPIRFGYKLWVLASCTGLPYHVEIYEGRIPGEKYDEPLGTRVVKKALERCNQPELHSVFFDNFFSSYQLFIDLDQMGFRTTGTIRNDRIKNCPIKSMAEMKKSERGDFDYRSSGPIQIVRWNDNAVVTIASNAYGVQPVSQVKRWVKGKGRQNVQQPAIIGAYNGGMGGVDLLDRALSDYRPVIHGKKWYWPLIVNALNIGFVYCWCIYRIVTQENVLQKDFRRHVVGILVRHAVSQIPICSLPARRYKVPDEIRLDGIDHYPFPGSVRTCTVCKKSC